MSGYARRSALMERWKKNIPESLQQKYDFYNYNYAVEILTQAFPEEWDELVNCLESFKLSINDLTEAGGAETKIPGKIDSTLYPEGWRNVKIKGDLHIDFFERKIDQKQYDDEASQERIVYRFIDGHHIDYYKPGVGIQLEWNKKDIDFDRALTAVRGFHESQIISVGVVITRGESLTQAFKEIIGPDGRPIVKKYGASSTWMGRLVPRIEARQAGECPVLAIGIRKECIEDLEK